MSSLRTSNRPPQEYSWLPGFLKKFDRPQAVVMFALIAVGLSFIYSIGNQAGGIAEHFWIKQSQWLALGGVVWLASAIFDYRKLMFISLPLYLVCITLLIVVLFFGTKVFGARRWLVLGGSLRLQPSEPAKIATIILVAAMMSLPRFKINNFFHLVLAGGVIVLPFLLIVLEPDLGSALVLLPVGAAMVFAAGLKWRYIIIISSIIIAVVTLEALNEIYRVKPFLKDYQRQRIEVFLDPGKDLLGRGYNQHQSRLAIGSGGVFGKGYGNSSQSTLGFLPRSVSNNDFIFSVIAEETGFAGCTVLLLIYFALLSTGLRTAFTATDKFGQLLATGITSLLFIHVFVNIGMSTGLMPVTGLPLPFLSYGGSFLVSSMFCLGILQSVRVHRSDEEPDSSRLDALPGRRARLGGSTPV